MSNSTDRSIVATAITHRSLSGPRRPPRGLVNAGVLCALLLSAVPAMADPPVYSLIELPVSFTGTAINNKGDMSLLGADRQGNQAAFLWRFSSKRAVPLGSLGGNLSRALALNDCGDVVGDSRPKGSSSPHAVLYRNGSVIDLAPHVTTATSARAINNPGTIVGSIEIRLGQEPIGETHPAIFENGTVRDLTGQFGLVSGVSQAGHIIGTALSGAFVIKDGKLTPITAPDPNDSLTAGGVNDFGDVAAFTNRGPTIAIPYLFQDGKIFPVSADSTGVSVGNVLALNNSGEMVGFFPFGDIRNIQQIATYQRGNAVSKLGDLVDPADPLKAFVTFLNGFGINDSGWIGALGIDSRDQQTHTYLLQRKTPAAQVQRVRGGCPVSDLAEND